MKTSRTNSFRLHHLGRSTSVRKPSQTLYNPDESFKLAAINSVNRGVKHSDLSLITGSDLNKLRIEPLEPNTGLYDSAHASLAQVRKKYDEKKKQRVRLEQKIEQLKEELNKFNIFNTEHDDRIKEGKEKVENLTLALEEKKKAVDFTITEKKVLLSMQHRYKADRVVYDQRKYDLETELAHLNKQLAIFQKEGHEVDESQDRGKKIYERLANQLQQEEEERQLHLRNLQNMEEEKMTCVQSNHVREHQIQQIAERAMQDKDLSEKQWRKIYLTHGFVNRMLRNKIEKEMQKFRTVEFAFKEIKTATGVTNAKTLITKYLNKEIVYGELLGKIADNEKTIDHLKADTDLLIKEQKDLQMELEVINSIKTKNIDLHNDLKSLSQVDSKAEIASSFQSKILSWTAKQVKKMQLTSKSSEEQESGHTCQQVVVKFSKYLQALAELLADTGKESTDLLIGTTLEPLSGKESERITRIYPKRSRRNSSGKQIFDVDEEETNPSVNHEEEQLINTQREELLRNNEKFMREVKRRKDEERKTLLDKAADERKKVTKAPEVKQVEEED